MTNFSCRTLASGARQFVVHDAFEMMWCDLGSYLSKLTPRTTEKSGFLAGAVMMTFLAPAARCFAALSRSVKRPVDSKTTSTPRSFHGRAPGSRLDSTLIESPLTEMESAVASIFAFRLPRIESYFSRWASVAVFVMSFTATKSMSLLPSAARMMLRPMRPNPLIPTLMGMCSPPERVGTVG